jgi:hypothetical protein
LSFNVNEIKGWAKSRGYTVKKDGEGYVWWGEGVEKGDPADIGEVATAIFNRITENRFVEHQAEFRRNGGLK